MGAISSAFSTAFRDFNTDGVSASGAYNPLKSLLRALGATIEGAITEVVTLTVTGGTGNAITAASSPAQAALSTANIYLFVPTTINGQGDCAIAVDSLGNTVLREENGAVLRRGRLEAGRAYILRYDGTAFLIWAPRDLFLDFRSAAAKAGAAAQGSHNPKSVKSAAYLDQASGHNPWLHVRPFQLGAAAYLPRRFVASLLDFGDVASLAAGATLNYGAGRSSATAVNVGKPLNRPGLLRDLQVSLGGAPGSGQNVVVTVLKNGSATTLTCTISNTATTGSDTLSADAVTVAAGDLLAVQAVASGGATTVPALSATVSLGV